MPFHMRKISLNRHGVVRQYLAQLSEGAVNIFQPEVICIGAALLLKKTRCIQLVTERNRTGAIEDE